MRPATRSGCGCCVSPPGPRPNTLAPQSGYCTRRWADGGYRGTRAFVEPVLAEVGLPAGLADALDDACLDPEIRQETDEALALTGKDVGTPSIQFRPPDGVAFSAR